MPPPTTFSHPWREPDGARLTPNVTWPRLFLGPLLSSSSSSSTGKAVVGRQGEEGQGASLREPQGLAQAGVPLRVEEELQGKAGVSGGGGVTPKPSASFSGMGGSPGKAGWGQGTLSVYSGTIRSLSTSRCLDSNAQNSLLC